MPLSPVSLSLFVAASFALASCGASATDPATPATSEVPSPPRPWAEMSHDERAQWMGAEVLPRMADLFAEYDAERFADFSCATCHGEDARERGFAMPNPAILPVHRSGTPGQEQMVRDYPAGTRFMFQRVVPTMQRLLGAREYDATTREGFSCYACHTEAPAAP